MFSSSLYIFGAGGFVGKNLISQFEKDYLIKTHQRNSKIVIDCDIVIHLAGKSQDKRYTSNPAEYYQINTEFAKMAFDAFLNSSAKVFIILSSVEAIADSTTEVLTEEAIPCPTTDYGKSKLLAEKYILSKKLPIGKRVFILRPCMIHGPGNKGNLSLLFNFIAKGIPWPLGLFDSKRSFCSIGNLIFVIKELIERDTIPSGVYNIADDEPLSTNEVILLIAQSKNRPIRIFNFPKKFLFIIAKVGNYFNFPINEERLHKLIDPFIVSNDKLIAALGKRLPLSSREGLLDTFNSFD